MSIELKPCPFCDGNASPHKNVSRVSCDRAGCNASTAAHINIGGAIQAWNTRTPSTPEPLTSESVIKGGEVSVHPALVAYAEILEAFHKREVKPQDTVEDKLLQWQACYAFLFKRMNELLMGTKPDNYTAIPHEPKIGRSIGLGDEISMAEQVAIDGYWVISIASMSQIARERFCRMVAVIKRGGQVDVVARCDGKDYRWECDSLKYFKFSDSKPVSVSLRECHFNVEAICGNTPEFNWRTSDIEIVIKAVLDAAGLKYVD